MTGSKNKTLLAVAVAGLAWNAFGVVQFLNSLRATKESLMSAGMTEAQAHVMTTYPAWMTVAFGAGTLGGLVGCALLLARRPLATPIFAFSLAAYVVLFIGDATEGVFAALGTPQVTILSIVVLIAAGLLAFSMRLGRDSSSAGATRAPAER